MTTTPSQFPSLTKPAEAMPPVNLQTVLIAIRCWWHIALPLGLLLGSAAAVLVYYMTTPIYTAQAWVMIKARPPFVVKDHSQDDPQKFVQNQIELMRSPMVLGRVATDSAVASTPELASDLDPLQYLRNHLRVRAQGNSEYYIIEFTSQSPQKAALIANRVATEYRALQDSHEKQLNHLTIQNLQLQYGHKQDQVKQLKARMDSIVAQGDQAVAASLARRGAAQVERKQSFIEAQLQGLELEQLELKATIGAAQQLIRQLSFEPTAAQIEAAVITQPQVMRIRELIDESKAKLAEHQTKSVDVNKNPQYSLLKKRIAEDEAALEKTLAELRVAVREDQKKSSFAQHQDQILSLQSRLQISEEKKKLLEQQVQTDSSQERNEAGDVLAFELARADYQRANDLLEAIAFRIDSMNTEQGAPARVEMMQEATVPARPDEAVPFKKMGMAACVGLAVPFGLAVILEMLFRRVSSRYQLEAAGQVAVVAEVTNLPARVKTRLAGGELCRDRQLFEESIDGLRTYLSLVDSTRGRKILAVTSAISREGKTSLASQLAVSIASATGRPTLLVDGDVRSPDVHRIFDVDRGPGLCEVLKGERPVEEAIETGFSENLHLLTAGELDVSPHRLLGNRTFGDMLDKLSGKYDQIVIDTPPILAASEALLLACAADTAIVCVRRDFSRVDQVADAFSRLRSAGVKTAGAVLNGIPARHYAYRYGSYYYNRSPRPVSEAEPSVKS